MIKRLLARGLKRHSNKSIKVLSNKELKKIYFDLTGKVALDEYKRIDYLEKISKENTGFIYLIGNLEYNFVKIGYSVNPEKRLMEIQTGCPFPLVLFDKFEGTISKEKLLHRKYKRLRTYGEWFRIEGKLAELCV